MGTKNNPGAFDCYAAAAPDEPMFILLGRDPCAFLTVLFWVRLREAVDPNDPKLEDARRCANEFQTWAHGLGKDEEIQKALSAALGTAVDQAAKPT